MAVLISSLFDFFFFLMLLEELLSKEMNISGGLVL